ncbi:MAG: carbon-nitrogen hydrolase family protein [Fimbriimonas sp.]|nr:carbon-nitrogen hydrolase family protein [Fimbriimonas sp.]
MNEVVSRLSHPGSESRFDAAPSWVVAGLQMTVSRDIEANKEVILRAIDRAAQVQTEFLLTPEGSLSGYHAGFDQGILEGALASVTAYAKARGVGILLGTCFKGSEALCYNQVRVYSPLGEYLGAHSKILLCSSLRHPGDGEMSAYAGGALRTFTWKGVCFGVLICNDLWATPGFTTLPNPYLAWQLRKMGAEIIFHAVNATGPEHDAYRAYHEANQNLWARALGIPFVTTNAVDASNPSCCRAGVIGPDGERHVIAPDSGEQFFTHRLTFAEAYSDTEQPST